ncbi:glycosyltransferase family 2 protein [Paratractidigestivibacter faecalis]|uniref:glycosyltransferase family 2 protein n=1 Tax=Paratractidigestivibacter faecalis TaxID=2292441 RepID=UPI001300310B|nr:glycosyltransferase family 2 protein [Paratractidigestivibacter faecalis]
MSVIIPSYNAESYIEECVNSVLSQSLKDFELIVVDDGSTDSTVNLIKTFQDNRLSLIEAPHSNAGRARNLGMYKATGDYLYFLDADDFISEDCLLKLTECAKESNADVVICKSHYLDDKTKETSPLTFSMIDVETNKVLAGDALPHKPFQSFVGWPWDKLFRRDFVDGLGIAFQEQRTSNDALFVFVALAKAARLYCTNDDLVTHRTNNVASLEHTRSKSWRCALSAMEAIGSYLKNNEVSPSVWKSYCNWVAHFSRWNMASLDSDALSPDVADAFFELIGKNTLPASDYYNPVDADFAALAHATNSEIQAAYVKLWAEEERKIAELVGHINKLESEKTTLADSLRMAEDRNSKNAATVEDLATEIKAVRNSHSYKLGNKLLAPLSFMKQRLSL